MLHEGAVVPPCTRAARPLTPPPPSLVETSTNLAAVKPGEGGSDGASFTVTCSTRSSLAAPLELVGAAGVQPCAEASLSRISLGVVGSQRWRQR